MNDRSIPIADATHAIAVAPRNSPKARRLLYAALLLALPWPRTGWPLDSDFAPRDRTLELEQQSRQRIMEQRQLQTERRQEQDAKNLEAYPRDRVLETRQQLQQQLLEQRRLTAEKRQEQQLKQLDAFPKDKTIELRQQLRQQFSNQRQLSEERRGEQAANRPPATTITQPPVPQTDVDRDAPR